MRFYIELKQIVIAIFFFFTIIPLMIGATIGFGNSELGELDLSLRLFLGVYMFLSIPISIYIAIFTKFNNPFKKIEVDDS